MSDVKVSYHEPLSLVEWDWRNADKEKPQMGKSVIVISGGVYGVGYWDEHYAIWRECLTHNPINGLVYCWLDYLPPMPNGTPLC